jgi:protein-tyrosine phosphatase
VPDLSHLRDRDEILITMVCLGNICRSPMAAAVLANRTSDWSAPKILVDSAGTSDWHVGEGPNPPSKKTWETAGYKFDHVASQITEARMKKSDLILVMDRSNHRNVLALTQDSALHSKVHFLRDFDYTIAGDREVPDPYSLPDSAFEEVLGMVERAVDGLLEELSRS